MDTMKKSWIILAVALLPSSQFAQINGNSSSDKCEVIWGERGSKKIQTLGKLETVVGEEESTTRTYRIPKTKYFLVANVFYTDEGLSSSDINEDSVSLQL